MAHVALYRKYRSQSFGELMGQEHVTRTLQNAIKSGEFSHAYLFYGARGCGKTSTARLIARALNCVAQDGPSPEPCGQCRLCLSIREGNCLDVVEIDAASETSIDDVREKIIENVQYAPAEARYKVYIIDEVHDLSAKAFDALLKTLEEPPAHVIFILATTEQHKVPITIRSRCQQFQFKRGTLQDLAIAVQRVVEAEGCAAEPEAIQAIARSAEGSWRDALSLLEQVLAYSEGHLTAELVHRAVGTVGTEMLLRVTETLGQGRWDATLAVAAELIESGADVRQLLTALSGHLRDLIQVAVAPQAAEQELGAERVALLQSQASLFEPQMLLAMIGELAKAETEIRRTNQHRILLETTLLRLMPDNIGMRTPEPGLSKISDMAVEARLTPPVSSLTAAPTVVPKPPVPGATPAAASASFVEEEDVDESDTPLESALPESQSVRPPERPQAPALEKASPPTQEATPAPAPVHQFADAVTLEVVRRAWPRILKMVEQVSKPARVFLENTEVAALEGRFIVLSFQNSISRDRIQNKGRELVEKAINKALESSDYKIRCVLPEASAPPPSVNVATEPPPPPAPMTLLDAPPAATSPTRIADFDIPPPPPPVAQNGAIQNGAHAEKAAEPAPPEETPANSGLLAEALELFGGEVIRSEPLT